LPCGDNHRAFVEGVCEEGEMTRNDKEWIDKEDWNEAPGVIAKGTNSALAKRDYSVKCDSRFCITIIKGYWIWWCSAHHQPLAECEKDRLR